jgi:hypothetical protein
MLPFKHKSLPCSLGAEDHATQQDGAAFSFRILEKPLAATLTGQLSQPKQRHWN